MWKLFVAFMVISLFIVGNGETRRVKTPPQPVTAEVNQPETKTLPTKSVLPKHTHKASCEKTTAEPVQIICILDRSGSMSSLVEDTIGGYNTFLTKQKDNSGEAQVTTVLFDNEYELIADAVDLQEISELTNETYYARGTTALLDAIGRTVTTTLGRFEKDNICPEKRRVLVMIMTDGLENASREYSKATVKSLIEETTEKYHWNYIFMGANIDSVAEASSIGIKARHAMNYAPDRRGVHKTFDKMSEAAEDVRARGSVSEDWKE